MATFPLRDVPNDTWKAFDERRKEEGWPSARTLIVQLLEDYGQRRLDPSIEAPQRMQAYAWLRPYYRSLAERSPNILTLTPGFQWEALRNIIPNQYAQRYMTLLDLNGHEIADVLEWLKDTSQVVDDPAANRLTLHAMSWLRSGPAEAPTAREVIQYEVIGLPPGEQAWIGTFGPGRFWRLLRAVDGQQGHWSEEPGWPTAADALRWLEVRVEKERTSAQL